jgi:hypothetical protein
VCLSSRFGDCCSSKGWCGKDGAYCGDGCQSSFGNCTVVQGSSSGNSSVKSVSTDGSCGGSTGFVCLGSTFGYCCSEKGYCGGNSSYCSAGCQPDFGHCSSSDGSEQVSTDGSCGKPSDTTCLGSTFGDCCSAKGYCGGNSSSCDAGCQSAFGKCSASTNAAPSATANAASATSSSAQQPVPTVQTTGFKAGIAVASTAVFLSICSLALLLVRRRNCRNRHDQAINIRVNKFAIAEAPPDSKASNPAEMSSTEEISTKTVPFDLSTVAFHRELPANEKQDLKTKITQRAK